MNKPLISIVIPTYNREETLVRVINSVLNQTYSNYEIIVVDDGSTDSTKEKIQDFIDSGNIQYYKIKNSGVCFARNFGIKKAKGEYVSLLDSDDEYFANRLERQLFYMQEKGVKISLSYREESIDGRVKKAKQRKNLIISDYKSLVNGIPLSATLMMFKKEVFDRVTFDILLPSGNDLDFLARVLGYDEILFIGEPLNVINKSLKYKRISTNYVKKIEGYKKILRKIEANQYPPLPDIKIFRNKIFYNLSIFYLFNENYSEAKSKFYEIFKSKEYLLIMRIKGLFLYFLSNIPSLFKFLFSVATVFWKKGLI